MRRKPQHGHGGGHSNNNGGKMRPRRHGGGGGGGNNRGGGYISDDNNSQRARRNAMSAREKYLNMARDAQSSGDRVLSEYYYQHADHYFRVIEAAEEQMRERGISINGNGQPQQNDGNNQQDNPNQQSSQQHQSRNDDNRDSRDSKPHSQSRSDDSHAADADDSEEQIGLPASVVAAIPVSDDDRDAQ